MMESGKEIKSISDSLGLPATNAIELDEAFGLLGMTLWGKMEYETIESTNDKVVQRITICPNLNTHEEMDAPIISMLHICHVFF